MSKIHISPTMIAIIADNCKTIQELQELIKLVQKTAHPYQISWIQGKIENMKLKEKQSLIVNNHNIKLYRKKYNMTQKELAEALGVNVATVNRWERKIFLMTKDNQKTVSEFFHILEQVKE